MRFIHKVGVCTLAAFLYPCAPPVSAEPSFLSKQYTRCTSCHISPTGGGLLSAYGRSLSGQELSMTSGPPSDPDNTAPARDEQFLWGALDRALGPVQLGVELRPSHIRSTFDGFTFNRNLLMNADVVAAVQSGGWTMYGEVGREPVRVGSKIDSYEHWVGYESTAGFGVRAGRLFPAYGVHLADHTSFNRANLGFDKYDQVYGVELSRSLEKSLVQVTLSPGLADSLTHDVTPHAFQAAGRVQVDLGPSTAVVASGIYRNETASTPQNGSAGLAFGFAPTRRVSIWTQGDVRGDDLNGSSLVFVNETSFEAMRGLWLKVSPQLRTESGPSPQVMRWALSAMLLPRTHYQIGTSYYRDKPSGSSPIHTWLVQLHMYI